MYVILILAVIAGVAFLLMKSGKIEDKNGNNIPDKLEPMVEEVKEVVKKVKKAVEETKPAKKTSAKKSAKKAK
jgi:non-homologous end joining protein Ku